MMRHNAENMTLHSGKIKRLPRRVKAYHRNEEGQRLYPVEGEGA